MHDVSDNRNPGKTNEERANEWFTEWIAQDYSWQNLTQDKKRRIASLSGYTNITKFEQSDLIIKCGKYGAFHIFNIPNIWASSISKFPLSPEELADKKIAYWEAIKKQTQKILEELLQGAHVPDGIGDSALDKIAANKFVNVFFDTNLRSGRVLRNCTFTNCHFNKTFHICSHQNGSVNPPSGYTYIFSNCIFTGEFCIQSSTLSVTNLQIENCHFQFEIIVTQSNLRKFELYHCTIEHLRISDSNFMEKCRIERCIIGHSIDIRDCIFHWNFALTETEICTGLFIEETEFKARFGIEKCVWPDVTLSSSSGSSSVFHGTCTLSAVQSLDEEYYDPEPIPVQFFSKAEFKSDTILDQPISEADWDRQFKKELSIPNKFGPENIRPDRYLEQLGNGCVKLAALAKARGDDHEHFLWIRNALKVRLFRKRGTLPERIFSYLYWVVADFGYSIKRPAFWLIFITMLMGAIYSAFITGIDINSKIDWNKLATGLSYSASRTVPFGIFEAYLEDQIKVSIIGELPKDGFTGFAKRLLLYCHTAVSVTILYILLMTIRRKFMMK